MNDIQKARDVLAKWRKYARDGQWSIEADTEKSSLLARGTAGNPDLLDAIDGFLRYAVDNEDRPNLAVREYYLAPLVAAVIAADERMSS